MKVFKKVVSFGLIYLSISSTLAQEIKIELGKNEFIKYNQEKKELNNDCVQKSFKNLQEYIRKKSTDVSLKEFLLENNSEKVKPYLTNKNNIFYFFNGVAFIYNLKENKVLASHGLYKEGFQNQKWNLWSYSKDKVSFESCFKLQVNNGKHNKIIEPKVLNVENKQELPKEEVKSISVKKNEIHKEISKKEEINNLELAKKLEAKTIEVPKKEEVKEIKVSKVETKKEIKEQSIVKKKSIRQKNDEEFIQKNIEEIKSKGQPVAVEPRKIPPNIRLCMMEETQKLVLEKYPEYDPASFSTDDKFKKHMDASLLTAMDICYKNK